jgi:hypothetical protein
LIAISFVIEPISCNLGVRILALALAGAWASLPAADPLASSVTHKLDLIESGQAKPGSVFRFTAAELNAWARATAPVTVGEGLRQPRLELGNNSATGYALVDFLKLRHSAGVETNWLVAKLIQGEKPVMAKAQLESGNGRATVHLQRVEIGGLTVSGATLDFLIKNFFLPLYPDAKIDEPFELAYRIDRIEVTPAEARVYIRK